VGIEAERRRFLTRAAATVGAAGAWTQVRAAVPPGAVAHPVPPDPSKALGVPLPEEGYGLRSQFETSVRTRYKTSTPYSSWTFTPLQDSVGILTPSGLHFERSHAGTAIIDPAKHFLYVHEWCRRRANT
jgi:sulfane dehydrogenase subunit SoxC